MEHSAPIKAIVVDLDNTLLHTDKSLSDHTVAVLKKCKERGIKCMVATARPYRTATSYFERVGFDAITVSNGARAFCGENMIEHGISPESVKNCSTDWTLMRVFASQWKPGPMLIPTSLLRIMKPW